MVGVRGVGTWYDGRWAVSDASIVSFCFKVTNID